MVPKEEPVGRVTEYDPELGAARVHLEEGDLAVGDRVHIEGPDTDVEEDLEELQLPTGPAQEAHAGDDVGFAVPEAVETGARVLRVAGESSGASAASEDPYDAADASLLDQVFQE